MARNKVQMSSGFGVRNQRWIFCGKCEFDLLPLFTWRQVGMSSFASLLSHGGRNVKLFCVLSFSCQFGGNKGKFTVGMECFFAYNCQNYCKTIHFRGSSQLLLTERIETIDSNSVIKLTIKIIIKKSFVSESESIQATNICCFFGLNLY